MLCRLLRIVEEHANRLVDDPGCFIAEDAGESRVRHLDPAIHVRDDEGIRDAVENRVEQRLFARELALRQPLLAKVDHDAGKIVGTSLHELPDGEVDGHAGPVFVLADDLAADADDAPLARRKVARDEAVVRVRQIFRHEHRHVAADELRLGIPEHALDGGVRALDDAAGVDGNDRGDGRVEDGPEARCVIWRGVHVALSAPPGL